MDKQKILKVLSILIILLISISSLAASTCLADKSDIAGDMKVIAEKLNVKYWDKNLTGKADTNQIYDNQQLKVDRSDKFLKQANAVGVITDAPIGSQKGYASAVLILPCHVLVNAHGVDSVKSSFNLVISVLKLPTRLLKLQ